MGRNMYIYPFTILLLETDDNLMIKVVEIASIDTILLLLFCLEISLQ